MQRERINAGVRALTVVLRPSLGERAEERARNAAQALLYEDGDLASYVDVLRALVRVSVVVIDDVPVHRIERVDDDVVFRAAVAWDSVRSDNLPEFARWGGLIAAGIPPDVAADILGVSGVSGGVA